MLTKYLLISEEFSYGKTGKKGRKSISSVTKMTKKLDRCASVSHKLKDM